ncbi:hypothetical protein V8G54_024622, partial [Vigna mungo]
IYSIIKSYYPRVLPSLVPQLHCSASFLQPSVSILQPHFSSFLSTFRRLVILIAPSKTSLLFSPVSIQTPPFLSFSFSAYHMKTWVMHFRFYFPLLTLFMCFWPLVFIWVLKFSIKNVFFFFCCCCGNCLVFNGCALTLRKETYEVTINTVR